MTASSEQQGHRHGAAVNPWSSPTAAPSGAQVLRRVRQQSDDAGALERHRQLALVLGAGARLAARLDLRALGQVAAEAVDLLVIDLVRLVGAERAHLPAAPVAVVLVALLGSGNGRHTGRPRLGSEGDGVVEFVAAGGWGGWARGSAGGGGGGGGGGRGGGRGGRGPAL